MNTCCAYFCTGMSMMGVIGLSVMWLILSRGGEWYLGVSEEDAPSAASACMIAAVIYAVYLFWCMSKLSKASVEGPTKVSDDDE